MGWLVLLGSAARALLFDSVRRACHPAPAGQPLLQHIDIQPVREAVSYRGLFTAGWFGVREKHCSRLKIYDRL